MRKSHSETRRQYAFAYRAFRQGYEYKVLEPEGTKLQEIIDCALETYDYHDSEFSGWINRQRQSHFTRAKQRYLNGERLLF